MQRNCFEMDHYCTFISMSQSAKALPFKQAGNQFAFAHPDLVRNTGKYLKLMRKVDESGRTEVVQAFLPFLGTFPICISLKVHFQQHCGGLANLYMQMFTPSIPSSLLVPKLVCGGWLFNSWRSGNLGDWCFFFCDAAVAGMHKKVTICIKVCRFSLPSILEDMGTARVTSSVVSCNSAITACDKAGQWERALHLFTSLPRSDRHVSSDEHALFCYDVVGQKTIQNGNRNNCSWSCSCKCAIHV